MRSKLFHHELVQQACRSSLRRCQRSGLRTGLLQFYDNQAVGQKNRVLWECVFLAFYVHKSIVLCTPSTTNKLQSSKLGIPVFCMRRTKRASSGVLVQKHSRKGNMRISNHVAHEPNKTQKATKSKTRNAAVPFIEGRLPNSLLKHRGFCFGCVLLRRHVSQSLHIAHLFVFVESIGEPKPEGLKPEGLAPSADPELLALSLLCCGEDNFPPKNDRAGIIIIFVIMIILIFLK